jgi:hypothetical protein
MEAPREENLFEYEMMFHQASLEIKKHGGGII